jgi:quercetin dioxygenase-like cupin family protein
MLKTVAALLVVLVPAASPQTMPIRAEEVTLRKEIYRDARVKVLLLDIPPGQATALHRHDRDLLSVFVTGGKTRAVFDGGAPVDDTFAVGDVRFRAAGFTHSTENRDSVDFLCVIFEFVESQGKKAAPTRSATRTCAADGQQACVDEKPLFCAAKFCVDEMTIAPQGVKQDGPATMDRMLVPVSGYTLSEQAEGTAATLHSRKVGEVEFIPAGPARRWTNTADTPARYVVVTYR